MNNVSTVFQRVCAPFARDREQFQLTSTVTENVTDVKQFTFLRDSTAGPSGALVLLDHSGHCI